MKTVAMDTVLGGASKASGWNAPPKISQKSACISRDRQANISTEVVGQFAGGANLTRNLSAALRVK